MELGKKKDKREERREKGGRGEDGDGKNNSPETQT